MSSTVDRSQSSETDSSAAALLGQPILEGWMLKKKRKKMQGFARRYFYLSQQPAVLSYSFSPNSRIRDSVFITLASISISLKSRSIHIDSGGSLVMHIKTLSDTDFLRWTDALQSLVTNGDLKERQRRRRHQQRKDPSRALPKTSDYSRPEAGPSVRPVELSNLYHSVTRMQAPLAMLEEVQADLRDLLSAKNREPASAPQTVRRTRSRTPPPLPSPFLPSCTTSPTQTHPILPSASTTPKGKKPKLFKHYSSIQQSGRPDPQRVLQTVTEALEQLKTEHLNLIDLINIHRASMLRDRSVNLSDDFPARPAAARHLGRLSTANFSSSSLSEAYATPMNKSPRRRRTSTITKADYPDRARKDGEGDGSGNDSGSEVVFHDAAEDDMVFVDLDAIHGEHETEAEAVSGLEIGSTGDDSDSESSSEEEPQGKFSHRCVGSVSTVTQAVVAPAQQAQASGKATVKEVQRRTTLPATVSGDEFSIFSMLKKNVGKDLSQVSFPISFNEPLSALQKLCEECEYVDEMVAQAVQASEPVERLVYVAGFIVSSFCSTKTRAIRKPFNPMLGETYECVRADKGMQFISEKVSHHPPLMAAYAQGAAWKIEINSSIRQKFWGQSLEIIPEGLNRLTIENSQGQENDVYEWEKPSSFVRNLVSGTKYLEHIGKVTVTNRNRPEKAVIEFKPGSTFGGEGSRNKVEGKVYDSQGRVAVTLVGKWDSHLLRTDTDETVLEAHPLPSQAMEYYGFTKFAIELNEITPDLVGRLPDTDTRLRPDQRLFEEGMVDEAEEVKKDLEEQQRARRKTGTQEPSWFEKEGKDWIYKGGYFEEREKEDPQWKSLGLFTT